MLELRLRSGQVVAFDGRVLEVFPAEGEPSTRFHVEQLDREQLPPLTFAPDEEPARARLLAAIATARPGG